MQTDPGFDSMMRLTHYTVEMKDLFSLTISISEIDHGQTD